jgi:hypothetical protein
MIGEHKKHSALPADSRSLSFQPARRTKHNFLHRNYALNLFSFYPLLMNHCPGLAIERKSKLGLNGKNKFYATFPLKVTRKESRLVCVCVDACLVEGAGSRGPG